MDITTIQQRADEWLADIQLDIEKRGSVTPRKDMLEFVHRKLAEAILKVADTLMANEEEIPSAVDADVHHSIDLLLVTIQYAHDRLWSDQ